jgi:hypothetical protein
MFPYRAKNGGQVFIAQTGDSSVQFPLDLYEEKADNLTGCVMKAQCVTDKYWLKRRSNFKDCIYNEVDLTLIIENFKDQKRRYNQ